MTLSADLSVNKMTLQGKKIVVTAYDLEQIEHRGIAVYSKALIRNLHAAGAEVWLLTEFDSPINGGGLNKLPIQTKSIIQSTKVLESLSQGRIAISAHWIESKIRIFRKLANLLRELEDLLEFFRRPRYYSSRNIHRIDLSELFDSPYLRNDRLGYLQYIEGILCARKLYFSTQIAALLKKQKPVIIDLKGFDVFITCCPLNIKPKNISVFAQTVHDIIPLEYALTHDNTLGFSHRLQACLDSRRIFVSESTAIKYQSRINYDNKLGLEFHNQNRSPKEKVFIQPPSLDFPSWLSENPDQVSDLRPVCHLLRPKQKKGLEPFKYLLFNSSVEARKNLLFLVKAYAESNLGSQGIRLCVTGRLKKDSYSKAVKEIVKNEPGILLTGYISESAKLDLYLNAMSLLSPSLVEGFGIPVLDSACLGMTAISSDCDSHREIQAMDDFADIVLLINTLESRDWAVAMQSVKNLFLNKFDTPAAERKRRINRYNKKQILIRDRFKKDLCELLA